MLLKKFHQSRAKEFESVIQLNLNYFRHAIAGVDSEWDGGSPKVGRLWPPELEKLLGPARREGQPPKKDHMYIAHFVQLTSETAFFNLLNALSKKHNTNARNWMCLYSETG